MIVTVYDSSLFSYAPATKTFHGNISEVSQVLCPFYIGGIGDGIVTGFGMRSVKTGRVVPFVLNRVVNDSGYDWDKSLGV
jgi:hypothetical protein